MSGRLQGKRAFVTAAAAGIGRASALAFARIAHEAGLPAGAVSPMLLPVLP